MHSTVHERTVEAFTEFTLGFHRRYDPDYVKVMFDENYDTPVNHQFIAGSGEWELLEEIDPHVGAFGRQIEVLKRVKDAVGPDVPVIQTVFSAFHIGYRLASRRILEDWKEDPGVVTKALEAIASNSARFAECCLKEAGIDGFFFGAYGCEESWMDREQYRSMVMPSDHLLLKGLRKAPILVLHIHGERGAYFDLLHSYPCDAISWEDRLAGPSIAEAKEKSIRCLVGGIDHYEALKWTPSRIVEQGRDAIRQAGGRGLILAPGCTFFNETPAENLMALKEAVLQGA
jgi:uroporphyrinogen decarboxylase